MEKSNLSKYIIIALIIGGLFYVGSLNKKISTLEKTVGSIKAGAGAGTAADTGGTAEVDNFNTSDLTVIAGNIGLNTTDFEACLQSAEIKKEVVDEANAGGEIGVNGTPGVFIMDNQTGNIVRAPGAVPIEMLKPMVEKLIAGVTEAEKKVDSQTGVEYTDKTKLALQPILATDYVKGDKNARFTLIEYSDIDCPYCKRFHPTAQQLVDEYNGQVSWVYRQFPLDQLHPNARVKAQGARCAGKLGGAEAFWKYLDTVAV
jgi:protein-disulfide isomerase